MRKKILILSIIVVFLTLIISSFWYFYYVYIPTRPKYLTSITALYSLFTDYMKHTVDYSLQAINCQPKEYYYSSSTLCFICDKKEACFGVGWVYITGGKAMNPNGVPYLRGNYSNNDLINFYSYGIVKLLDCKCKNTECICGDDIRAKLQDKVVKFIIPEEVDAKQKIKEIAEKMNMGECEFNIFNTLSFPDFGPKDFTFYCGILSGYFISNELWFSII